MNFLMNDKTIAAQYIDELFTGSTKIAAFCKFNDCSMCTQTTKLYARVLAYHESEMVQKLFHTVSKKLTNNINNNIALS